MTIQDSMPSNEVKKERMTIAEALTELKLIKERFVKRISDITKYASGASSEGELVAKQADHVQSLVQSAEDMLARYTKIKLAIQKANLETELVFKDFKFTIAEGLLWKQQILADHENIYAQLNENSAMEQLTRLGSFSINRFSGSEKETNTLLDKYKLITRYYDEKTKQAQIEKLMELRSYIDRLIENANHKKEIEF